MKIDTNLSIGQYIEVVNEIVSGFFDEDGSYVPHVGRIAAMGTFIDYCVKESKWDDNEDVDTSAALLDDEFINAYTEAITGDNPVALNFGNAYKDALAIVENKKSSVVQIAELINGFVEKYLTPDNIAKLFEHSARFKEILGNKDVQALIERIGEAYADSE